MPDRAVLLKLCKAAARDLKGGQFGDGIAVMIEFLDREPETVADLIDMIVRESAKKRPDDALLATLVFLVGRGLEMLRYRTERRIGEAVALVDRLRGNLLAFGREGRLQPGALLMILTQFIHAKLEMGEPLRELMAELAASTAEDADPDTVNEMGDPWGGAIEMAEGDPFLLFSQMFSHAGAFPAAQRTKMAVAMLQAEQETVREAAIGWLLDGTSDVRTAVAGALVPLCSQGQVSGVMLRRIVSLRNWLPEADRPSLDEAIRVCRQRGVVCASWPTPVVSDIFVSAFDGSGTQTLFVVVRNKRRYGVCCLLINLDVGMRDAWVQSDLTRRELDGLMQEVSDHLNLYPSSAAYLSKTIAHFLGVSISAGVLPPFALLEFAEAAGVGDLNPQATDVDELIGTLCRAADARPGGSSDQPPLEADPDDLLEIYPFLDSWFEDDDEVEALLAASPESPEAHMQLVSDGILSPRRGRWAAMLAWTAFALRESGGDEGWQDLARAARDVSSGQPLAHIPIMHAIATATADVYAQRYGPVEPG